METQSSNRSLFVAAAVLILAVVAVLVFWTYQKPKTNVNPVACTAEAKICPDGSAVGRTGPNCEFSPCPNADAQTSPITFDNIKSGDTVKSPLTVTGKAPGSWFFENSFPVVLLDSNGQVIAQGAASSSKNWMTSDLIPFRAVLTFVTEQSWSGKLVLKKDNPSGLPGNDKSVILPVTILANDYKNIGYVVNDVPAILVNGLSDDKISPTSDTHVITRYFGNEATGDFNGDGQEDIAFLITQETGGTGTFFYLVVALKKGVGYAGVNAVLLGDRIAPQTTNYENNQIVVNYATRAPGEPMTSAPTVGVSKRFKVIAGELKESK